MGAQKNIMNVKQNVFLKFIPKNWTAKDLEQKFSYFGPIKSTKVSLSPIIKKENVNGKLLYVAEQNIPCVSNGYGFICFENEEDTKKFIECEKNDFFEGIQTFNFRPVEAKNLKNSTNNLYIKNFDPSWDEAKIREIFG
jgi:RNA recognition motif-containing protein